MRLLDLRLQDFRNLEQVRLEPSIHATVAVGQNGQGKTNLLEALYFLCTLKPLRANRLSELVRFGSRSTRVTGSFEVKGARREISVQVADGMRQAFVDDKKAPSLEDYFGGVSVVAFTPDDLEVIKGTPDRRRWFLDRAVFNRFPAFLRESREYLRALKGRNRLLKDQAAPEYLDAYDAALSAAGARVWARRRLLVSELATRARAAFDAIGRTPDPAEFSYAPSCAISDFGSATETTLAGALREALASRERRDRERGFTSVGPHADDLTVRIGDRLGRVYGSQGQQRALVLAWKIAEVENLSAVLGFLPLLLLDDVSSELDPDRNAYLMRYLAASGAQVFLTTTDASLVSGAVGTDTLWCGVEAGRVSRQPRP